MDKITNPTATIDNKTIGNLQSLEDWVGLLATIKKNHKDFSAKKNLAAEQSAAHENTLTKPSGSLGRLEDLSQWFYKTRGIYDNLSPTKLKTDILVFAGNHGVATDGMVSAFPPAVTAMMVKNFNDGGAAINQLANWADANLKIIAMNNLDATNNFATIATPTPAMNEKEFCNALAVGWNAVDKNSHVVVLGDMGIGNSAAASAICHCFYGGPVAHWVGRGTGIDDATLTHKQTAVANGVAQYEKIFGKKKGLEILQFFGGFEMAAIMGAMLAGLTHHIPVILDSYVTVATFACLTPYFENGDSDSNFDSLSGIMTPHCPENWHRLMASLSPDASHATAASSPDASHATAASNPPTDYHGHALLLKKLGKRPLVDLGLRLGEGTGGLIALQLLKAALHCHHGMATFATAGVAEKNS